jgi:recombination protein RecR
MVRRAKAPVSLDGIAGMPEVVRYLMLAFGKIPGVGEKTAQRHALFLATADLGDDGPIAEIERAARFVRERVTRCSQCRALRDATGGEVCAFCADNDRDGALLCVVASEADRLAIERSGAYHGRYFVLGALLSPLEGVDALDLPTDALAAALTPGMEVILALPGTTDGDATVLYLGRELQRASVRVSVLPRGIAHGATLEHADQMTIAAAIGGRRVM